MKPLNGVRIVSVEQFGAAPYGSMYLADLGADVIKIENATIGGDPSRLTGPHFLGAGNSQYFQTWNTNKRSLALDLRTDEGRNTLRKLIKTADAVVNNLRGDLSVKMGLDYQALRDVNPALVCLHISAYGRNNDRAAWPGYDYLMQAESGLMDLTGEPDGPPARLGGPSIIDQTTGLTGALGLLAGIIGARSTGIGCDVDTSLFDVALHQLGYTAIWSLNEGDTMSRQPRSAHFSVTPVQTFPTDDGWVFIMCMTEKFWQVLLDVLDIPGLAEDPRFASASARHQNRSELNEQLDAVFSKASSAHWLSRLQGRLPIAPVLTVDQALRNPLLVETDMIRNVPHPTRPDFRMLANPLKINGQRLSQRLCSAVGADNAEILEELARQEEALK